MANGTYLKFILPGDVLSTDCLKVIYGLCQLSQKMPKLISIRQTQDKSGLHKRYIQSEINSFSLDNKNLFRFLCEDRNWGWKLSELCVDRTYFTDGKYYNSFDQRTDYSKEIISWFDMVLEVGVVMINEPLICNKSKSMDKNNKRNEIAHLREMLEFYCQCSEQYEKFPGFELSKKRYLSRHLMKHYWYGLKSSLMGKGTEYLKRVYRLQKQYRYYDFPAGGMMFWGRG